MHLRYFFSVMSTILVFINLRTFSVSGARLKRASGIEPNDCPKEISAHGIQMINIGIQQLYDDIDIEGGYYNALNKLYDKMAHDGKIKEKINKHLRMYELEKPLAWNDSIVHLYTTNKVYKSLNEYLRQHNCSSLNPKTARNELAAFGAALTAILLFGNYKGVDGITYRGTYVGMTEVDIYREEMKNDGKVLWTSFGSSSVLKTKAEEFEENVLYTIENDKNVDEKWKPKNIMGCSHEKHECEALYPPGSVFEVLEVTGMSKYKNGALHEYFEIRLRLKAAAADAAAATDKLILLYLLFLTLTIPTALVSAYAIKRKRQN